jgi:hypothetical protein
MMAWLKPWPMCRVPVTLGGGSRMQKLVGLGGVEAGGEIAARLPDRVPAPLDFGGFEAFGEFHKSCRMA